MALSNCYLIDGSLQSVLFGRNYLRVLTVKRETRVFLRRAMVLNHEQDAPPVRTLLNKVCFTKAFGFYVRKNN